MQKSIEASTSGIWLFWKLLLKIPSTRAKMPLKCPTLGSNQVIKCSNPGDISQAQKWQKDGRNAFSCRTNSLWMYQKLRNTVFTTKKSLVQSGGNRCYKVTECSAFLRHATNIQSVLQKKIPPIEITTSWPFHWHASSSLTLLINILAGGQSSWPELFILFYVVVLNRRYRYCISLGCY